METKERRLSAQQQILIDWATYFEQRTGEKYYINWGKEVRYATTLIEMDMSPDEYIARRKTYFDSPKWGEYGHWGFAGFVNNINKCIPAKKVQTKPQLRRAIRIRCQCGTEHDSMELCPNCSVDDGKPVNPKEVIEAIKGLADQWRVK